MKVPPSTSMYEMGRISPLQSKENMVARIELNSWSGSGRDRKR